MTQYVMRAKLPVKSRWDFLIAPQGRKWCGYGVLAFSTGVFAFNWLPHTLLLEQNKSFIQSYRLGMPRKVPDYIEKRIETATKLLKLSNFESKFVKSFMIGGFDVKEIGTLKSKYAGWVGVPINYTYHNREDIDRTDILLNQESIKWNSPYGQLLEKSLVLTEDEQIFAFCRSLLELRSWKLMCNVAYPFISILTIYLITTQLNDKLNLLKAHRAVRCIIYGLNYLFGFGLYCSLTDVTQIHRDRRIDEELAELGPEWCDAGVRFYEKLLNKNIAQRALSGNNGYTAKGNFNYFLREKSVPLTARKKFFEIKLEEYRTKANELEKNAADKTLDSAKNI